MAVTSDCRDEIGVGAHRKRGVVEVFGGSHDEIDGDLHIHTLLAKFL